jgi:hypothetical protein
LKHWLAATLAGITDLLIAAFGAGNRYTIEWMITFEGIRKTHATFEAIVTVGVKRMGVGTSNTASHDLINTDTGASGSLCAILQKSIFSGSLFHTG